MTVQDFYPIFLDHKQRFTTDTRKLVQGDIFFALKGGNFNGNAYALNALKDGASYAVVDEAQESDSERVVLVDNVLEFMQELATYHRNTFDIPVIAIAGSNGKTTTKELLISVLEQRKKVHATAGNFNNHIGVPITLLSMPSDTEIALIEIGTNGFGEIKFLSELLHPNFGLITNIGKEHLEGFGDIEGVAREESELFHYLMHHNGLAFVNADDPYLNRMSHRLTHAFKYSIERKEVECTCIIDQVVPQLVMEVNGQKITSVLNGMHNAQNIAAAIAVGRYFELTLDDIAQGVAAYQPSNNRSEVRTIGTNNVLMDAYNANPSSMEVALDTFSAIQSDNKVVLLGDMFELGSNSIEEHQQIVQQALEINNTQVFLAGEQFCKAAENLNVKTFQTTDELIAHLKKRIFNHTWFLVKGSRGMKMERVLEALEVSG